MSASGLVAKVERFAWFAVAVVLSGAWVFFELLAGYEIPARAHPILGNLVASALIFGGLDVSRVRRARALLYGDIPPRERKALAERLADLEHEDPELVASLRRRLPPGDPS